MSDFPSKVDAKINLTLFLILCISLLVSSCQKDDYLKGIDTNILFAPPTLAEIEAVKLDWQNRDLAVNSFRIEQKSTLSENGPVLQFVSFLVNNNREYGALIIPNASVPLPVYLFLNGYSNDNPVNQYTLTINTSPAAPIPFIYAIPAFRGQTLILTINGKEYSSPPSEGRHSDAFDGGTDDAIAFLNVIQAHFPQADANSVAVRGGSRGGTVALLMAERDKRVKLAVGVAFPTALIGLTAKHQNDPTYKSQFLQDLMDGSKSVTETRQKMIASSPLFFCESLPKTQIHFGAEDTITPAEQGDLLHNRLKESGLESILEFYTYPGRSHANIASDNHELTNRIQTFLSQLF
ncbi:prolyl oligopeptidase family serine peptidase [Rhodocytophaga rosea]|uniref:Prolyl oligopeptidase family serine peptidase n=1 Tax=Rhodocytophaga rosea TaxID=2704465 RepID=A0A6C0GHA9_9BACT|nr:prolyl oligopeptidase family serine peptidase [Rhodocytophaga rosea]QHT67416.1 prolyl oligopeptidase family serine peptidase [Rhodocytophaga rosea]